MSPGQSNLSRLEPVPPILRPVVRAYLLGYASAVAPRLLTLVLQEVVKRRRRSKQKQHLVAEQDNRQSFVDSAARILRTGLELQRFPAFCAALVGGTTLLQVSHSRILVSHYLHDHAPWRPSIRLADTHTSQGTSRRFIDSNVKGLSDAARLRYMSKIQTSHLITRLTRTAVSHDGCPPS